MADIDNQPYLMDNYDPTTGEHGAIDHPAPANVGTSSANVVGEGSPEGVIVAMPGITYLDTTNNDFWVKATGTGNTGWVELIG